MSGTYSGSDKRLAYLFENGGGGGGTTVIANPSGQATDDLEKLQVGETIYDIPTGGSSTLAGLGDVNLSSPTDGQVLKYDATNDEWVNGDGGSGGELYLNTIYSETEEKVGYWIDGKRLYQKTVHYNNPIPANSNNFQIPCGITTVDNMVSIQVVAVDSSGLMVQLPLHIYTSHLQSPTYSVNVQHFDKTTGNLRIDTGEKIGYVGAYVTLQYTKTTDTPEIPQRGNVIYLPTIYSQEEREVGVWTDGKPLYQKTLTCTFGGNDPAAYDFTITNDIQLKRMFGGVHNNGADFIHIGYGSGNDKVQAYQYSTTQFRFQNTYYSSRPNGIITIQYTKTTDTAGSGSWTPSGAPAVHYSTDEQVVGTWIDGSTLYEKTFEFTPATDTDNHVLDSTLTKSAISPKFITKGVYSLGGDYAGDSFGGDDLFTDRLTARMRVFINANGFGYNCCEYNSSRPFSRAVITIQYTKSS